MVRGFDHLENLPWRANFNDFHQIFEKLVGEKTLKQLISHEITHTSAKHLKRTPQPS